MKNLVTVLVFILFSISGYSQCVKGDCKNGEGVVVYSSGNKYMGNFKDGEKHGYGKFLWVSGAKYKGNWSNNKRNGFGEEFLANGNSYKGNFKLDKKHGEGSLYDPEGKLIKEGIWKDGIYISQNESASPQSKSKKSGKSSKMPSSKSVASDGVGFERFINLGLGLGSTVGGGFSTTNGNYSRIPPISVAFDLKEVKYNIKLGGYIGYSSDKITYDDNLFGEWGWKTSYIIVGLRGVYDFDLFEDEKIVTYVGGMLGYNVVNSSYFGDDVFSGNGGASASSFTYSGFIGLRYMLAENYGAFAELGYGIAYLTAGISRKF